MNELKRTPLFDIHVEEGATMVDFGGWEMPIQYKDGIIKEHLYTRSKCGIFDVSHMGRLLIEGVDRFAFLQSVLSSDVARLAFETAQYCIIPDDKGGAIDDAYLYRFEENRFLLVVNASNKDKDIEYFSSKLNDFDCEIHDISDETASIAVQGPESRDILARIYGCERIRELKKNELCSVNFEGHYAQISRTGYTGEPFGYEVYTETSEIVWIWKKLVANGGNPAGLGARDTLRMEAGFPLYGHEMGKAPDGSDIPIFALPLAKFAVSFSINKSMLVGRDSLEEQYSAIMKFKDNDFSEKDILPKKIMTIALTGRGVIRRGMELFKEGKLIGWVTSGTMIPYYEVKLVDDRTELTDTTGKRSIGIAYIDSEVSEGDAIQVEIRGKLEEIIVTARNISIAKPPYARPIVTKSNNNN